MAHVVRRLPTSRLLGLVPSFILLAMACGAPTPYDLHVENETDLSVRVQIGASFVAVIGPHASATLEASKLPAMPWSVEARTALGRRLLSLAVRQEDISVGGNSQRGAGARLDLSCGRLDVWVGVPMLGPAPGPGMPGDCNP